MAALLPVSFEYGKQRTKRYLTPGNQLRLTPEFSDFYNGFAYSGRGSNINNCLARSQWAFEYGPPGNDPRPMDKMGSATTPTEMRQCADAFRQKRLFFLADYAVAHPLPAPFQRGAKATIAADWATALLYYAQRYWPATSDKALPKAYFNFLAEVPAPELNR